MAHIINSTILREYDIRGTFGRTLHEADAHAIGRSFATLVRRAGGTRVVVGRDGRRSSPALETALVDGLAASGIDAVRIGIAPSPMLYFAEKTLPVDGGIQVTGSHNPADDNGFKMVLQGRPFFGGAIRDLAALAAAGDWTAGEGRAETEDVADTYVAHLVRTRPAHALRIGWDAGNGAAGAIVEKLTKLLPGEHHLLFTDIDGDFPNHHPDPTEPANLAHLQRLVADKRLDFGVAFDGDGDRIGAIDGLGRVIAGDQLLSILVQPVLAAQPGAAIVIDVKASQLLPDRIVVLGGRPVTWKSGHSNIKEKMREVDAPLGGEMSGHVFFGRDEGGYDDALLAAVRLIEAVGVAGGSLTALCDAMPRYANTPELRFAVAEDRKFAVVEEIAVRLREAGAAIDDTDGVRVTTDDGWWLLRASNTEAALTARAEGHDDASVGRLMAQLDAQLTASGVLRPHG